MPAFSVIIPVYNVEKYLRECLDSLVNQTLSDIEIICINDGSTDGSLNILNEYASKDGRFIVLSQENQGQGIARNKGIDIAKGEYISFVDPDDWIELDTFEILYNKFSKTGAEIIQFDYETHHENGKYHGTKTYKRRLKKDFNFVIKNDDIYNWHNIFIKEISQMSLCIWDKAYKTDFIKKNNIKLAPNKHGEDHIFSIGANLLADKILYLNKSFYHYRTRFGSAVNKASDDNFCIFDNVILLKEFLVSNNLYTKYEKSFKDYTLTVFAWHYTCIPEASIERYLNKCAEILSEQEYKKFLKETKGKRSFMEQIFSIKNQKVNGVKFKVVTILGIPFEIKHIKNARCK